jgi:NAD(P)-dependent dehydrogenase (short-subunit alcohol dehydrogenase family)
MATPRLSEKVSIVTGGGRGLGRAMVLALAGAGAKVVATAARTPAEVESVAREAGEDRVLPLLADVTRPGDCERAVDAACRRFGGLHLLVNNAGRGMKYISEKFLEQPSKFWEADPETWQVIIDTNVNGPFFMARAALPILLAQHWGRIINISMNHATMRRRGFSPYGPSKAALESETIIWAQDLEGRGVTVNALLPGGATATGMIPENVSSELKSKLLAPEIIVPPLLWLASEDSDGVTGRRIDASRWREGLDTSANVANAVDMAGWTHPV